MEAQIIIALNRMVELQEEILGLLHQHMGDKNSTAPDELMTRQQVKDYLKISETTYIRKVNDGSLKPIKMPGGDRFFKRDLVDAFNESIRRGRI